VFGILIGMLFARVRRAKSLESGIRFTGKKILQYAIISAEEKSVLRTA